MDYVTILGLIAAALTSFSFAPQALKCYREKSAKDLSWGMLCMMFIGVALWLAYGLMINDLPLIAANAISTALLGISIIFKFKYG